MQPSSLPADGRIRVVIGHPMSPNTSFAEARREIAMLGQWIRFADQGEANAAVPGQGGDPADADPERPEQADPDLADEADQEVLQDDRLPGRLRTAARPGSLQAEVDDDYD